MLRELICLHLALGPVPLLIIKNRQQTETKESLSSSDLVRLHDFKQTKLLTADQFASIVCWASI